MYCLYCGKEIGALRLLRDSEFCSVAHRKSYKDRLDKVLHLIADEEHRATPPRAGFRKNVQPHPGLSAPMLALWQPGRSYPLHTVSRWSLQIPALAHRTARSSGLQPVDVSLPPRPIARWLRRLSCPEIPFGAVFTPQPEDEAPPLFEAFVGAGAPEIVARWLSRTDVSPSAARMAVVLTAYRFDARLAAQPRLAGPWFTMQPEPAAAYIVPSGAALPLAFAARATCVPALETLSLRPVLCMSGFFTVPAAEPAAFWLGVAQASEIISALRITQPAPMLELSSLRPPSQEAITNLDGLAAEPAASAVSEHTSPNIAPLPIAAPVFGLLAALPLAPPLAGTDGLAADLAPVAPESIAAPQASPFIAPPAEPQFPEMPLPRRTATQPAGFPTVPEPALPAARVAEQPSPVSNSRFGLRLPGMQLSSVQRAASRAAFSTVPVPEPAALWIAAAQAPIATVSAQPAAFSIGTPAIAGYEGTLPIASVEPVPTAEPVACLLSLAAVEQFTAAEAVAHYGSLGCNLTAELEPLPDAGELMEVPVLCVDLAKAAAAEPVACLLSLAAVEQFTAAEAVAHYESLGFNLAAELEPLPDASELMEVPALWTRMAKPAAAEPVWNFLSVASAQPIAARLPASQPVMAAAIAPANVPLATSLRGIPQAEPVMAGVWPRMAETAIEAAGTGVRTALPTLDAQAAVPARPAECGAAPSLAAEPVEERLAKSNAGFVSGQLPLQTPSFTVIDGPRIAARLAKPAVSLRAEEVASSVEPASSEALRSATPALLPYAQAIGSARMASGRIPATRLTAASPKPAAATTLHLRPVQQVTVILPQLASPPKRPTVPRPAALALEYHIQRTKSVPYARPEWKNVRFEPLPPSFTLRPALDNPEELVRPKAQPVTLLTKSMHAARKRPVVMEHFLKVAAAVLIVSTVWLAANAMRTRRVAIARTEESGFGPNRVLTAEQQSAKRDKAKGPLSWIRDSIADRASLQVGDDFQNGMQRWGAAPGAMPARWQRNPAGYVHTGTLALFAPTLKFADYKLEFFGMIESRNLGWVVRAKDEKNYHAMKFRTLENGLRPILAMVHYDVVNGVAGTRTETPLNVMVHNNRPFQVAVDVRGTHLITSVNGEQVDNFRQDALASGGVGFFSEASDRARLYWARVTKNDDWLGHVCAFLSGGEAQATAEIWPQQVPGGAPTPWSPDSDPAILAAAWIGLPSIRRTQFSRRTM